MPQKAVENALANGPYASICTEPLSASSTAAAVVQYAGRAVLTELVLTPKPGLVDRRNCGAHHDMDFQTFLAGARAIAPWWRRFLEKGYATAQRPARALLPLVRPIGVLCEQAMFLATHGINTHKGAIFSLGLLSVAVGRLLAHGIAPSRERICRIVASMCAGLVERELNSTDEPRTAAERVFRRYGLSGARGEAASGYATVRELALPVYYRLRREGIPDEAALLQVLLHLLAFNPDTNLVSRGGLAGLEYVRGYARQFLADGGVLARGGLERMAAFDDELIARHLSPGGSADLLGVTWFLAQFPSESMEARFGRGRAPSIR
jgi:triphosphoribosyl-dephospho-CoA synthase